MKHRSVSKVRSNKLSQKARFVARQIENAVTKTFHPIKQVWVSSVFIKAHTDAQTKVEIPARIMQVNGTYCRAKHDYRTTDIYGNPTIKRYQAKTK